MDHISITHGSPKSASGGRLLGMALDYMAYPVIGTADKALIENTLQKLWILGKNRFSHQYAFEARLDNKTIGIVSCYPVSVMDKLAWPTARELIKLRKWKLIKHSLLHLQELWSMVSLNEGRADEYHIGALAALPESRGYGVGSRLIQYAEDKARLSNYGKCSLTVRQENFRAIKLYERLGYKITDSIEKKPYYLYRMVKTLPRILT
ncbi:acetyltransferase [Paenibacillus riograndensis]|uniref:Acetyltransferase n=1 Tax=Paenibacillus riograndensis TaxID=483937 RepID=A0A132U8W6_9BACL|nr:N-acetyltransferase [Paenibacillus riograndensis]KWX79793.1 acetyltransferase [Paenibacillus riograndensis]